MVVWVAYHQGVTRTLTQRDGKMYAEPRLPDNRRVGRKSVLLLERRFWRTRSRPLVLIYLFILGLRLDFPNDEILFGCTNRVAELFQVGANLVIHLMHNTLPRKPVLPVPGPGQTADRQRAKTN